MAFYPLVVPFPYSRTRGSVRYINYGSPYYDNYYDYPFSSNYSRYRYPYHGGYVRRPYYSRAVLGPLPDDFLCIPDPAAGTTALQQQHGSDHAMAAQLQMMNRNVQVVGRLQITVVRAVLYKNYGLTRMDPYTRLHFGQQVFETQTDLNGAKNPVWNKTFYIYQLPKSIQSFHMEVYDEKTITVDERIAWVTIPLPGTELNQGEVCDKWYKLSGRLGDDEEGSIHVIMAYETGPAPYVPPMVVYGGVGYPGMTPYGAAMPMYATMPQLQQQQVPGAVRMPPPPPPPVTDKDVEQIVGVFPDVEAGVVRSVLEASGNDKDAAVTALLAMQPPAPPPNAVRSLSEHC